MTNDNKIIYGINPVLERIKSASEGVKEILISDAADRQALRFIKAQAARLGVTVVSVPPGELDSLAGSQKHQGIVAKIEPYPYLSLAAVLEDLSVAAAGDIVLVLDGLTDPRNFGALLRTAEAVGVRYVLIPKDRSVDVTPVAFKASAGAAHHLRIAKVTNLRRALASLKKIGYWITGLDVRSRQTIYDCRYPPKLALVIGSEGRGIRPVVLSECDFKVAIPMLGRIASLNVAVAGAVFLYEALRQKRVDQFSPGAPIIPGSGKALPFK
jgi:23S rRNA (guanosine2251-2'-O)-methyltransferase